MNMKEYMNPDFMSMSWSDAFANVFGAGKAAFGVYRSSQTDETVFAETYPDVKWDVVTSLKNKDFGTFGATDCLTLMSAAEDKELAMNFIKHVTGAEFMEQYHAKCPGAALTNSEPYVGDAKMEKIYTDDLGKWHGLQVGPCGVDILTQLSADFQGIAGSNRGKGYHVQVPHGAGVQLHRAGPERAENQDECAKGISAQGSS